MNDLFFDKEIDSGSICRAGHPIRLVAEGYGYCTGGSAGGPEWFYAWRFSPPSTSAAMLMITACAWEEAPLTNGKLAWVQSSYSYTKQEVLDAIAADIDVHRNLPFDEERERARLVAV